MAARTDNSKNQEQRSRQASHAMTEIRAALYRRMVDFVLANQRRLRDEVLGEDTYSFTLQQLDEQFLNKLSIVDRAACELSRSDPRDGQLMTTTYETIEVIARREDLPQRIADALAEHADSDFLDMCVLRADEQQAEVILVLAREESGAPAAPARPEQLEQGEVGEQTEQSDERSSESSGGAE